MCILIKRTCIFWTPGSDSWKIRFSPLRLYAAGMRTKIGSPLREASGLGPGWSMWGRLYWSCSEEYIPCERFASAKKHRSAMNPSPTAHVEPKLQCRLAEKESARQRRAWADMGCMSKVITSGYQIVPFRVYVVQPCSRRAWTAPQIIFFVLQRTNLKRPS
jgi:hypothetical protein